MKVINREVPSEDVSTSTCADGLSVEAPSSKCESREDIAKPGSVGGGKFSLSLAFIAVMCAVLYALLSAFWPKFSRAEVFFAECAREMIATSNLVTPLYHGQAFFDKPILVYWFIIGCFKSFGTSHFAARVPSIIASVATLLVTGYACRAIFGSRAALIASMALGTSFMYLSFSALCMSDSMLVLVDTVTLILLYAGFRCGEKSESQSIGAPSGGKPTRTTLWFLAAASMGFGFLTKGPVAVVLPAVFFLAFLFVEKQLKLVKFKHVLLGAIALCVIAAPWFYLAYQANGIDAITYFFIKENVQRFAGSTYDTHRPIWFMVVSLLGGFLPWSIFLPPILWVCVKNFISARKRPSMLQAEKIANDRFKGEDRGLNQSGIPIAVSDENEEKRVHALHVYLWLWIAVSIGFFSVSRGKIDYYALPAFPACAMLTGYFLDKWIAENNRFTSAAAFALNVVLLVVGFGITALLNEMPYAPAIPPVAVGALPVVIGLFGLSQVFKAKQFASFATIFSGIVLAGSVFAVFAMPVLIRMSPALHYADTIRASDNGADRTAELKKLVEQKRGLADPTRNLAGAAGASQPVTDVQSLTIGMYTGVEHWIDEVTFRTEREPVKLSSAEELSAFLSRPGTHWLMIKNVDFDALPAPTRESLEIVARQGFIPKSLNPGYILKHRGDLTGGNELILARRN
ncbi:glycosyltransferase family 39 protein [Candidatus Obscuribacterales bacterium]|nr:glycosyltransferase family 39 protein [Candidatus Obscuribacterales bacterium]